MEVRLLITHGKANVKEVLLGAETVIGRSTDCNLKIASGQVSRRHCRITVSDSKVRVCDLGSANGTFVNGKQLPKDKDIAVAPGAALVIGPLKFVVQFKPPAPPAVAVTKPLSAAQAASKKTVSPEDAAEIQSFAAPKNNDEETVDFLPSQKRRDAAAIAARTAPQGSDEETSQFVESPLAGAPKASSTAPKEIRPEPASADTLYDANLADAARELAERSKKPSASPPAEVDADGPSKEQTHEGTHLLPDSVVQELAAEVKAPELPQDEDDAALELTPMAEGPATPAEAAAEDSEEEVEEEVEEDVAEDEGEDEDVAPEPAPKRGFFGFLKFGKKKPAVAVEDVAVEEEEAAEEAPDEDASAVEETVSDSAVTTDTGAANHAAPPVDAFAELAATRSAPKEDDFDLDWLAPAPNQAGQQPKAATIASSSPLHSGDKGSHKNAADANDDEPESDLKNFLKTFKDD